MKAKALFISYDGMTDPLGQSQVLPYLAGLSAKGIEFHLISFEKKERYEKNSNTIEKIVKQNNITWHPLIYTKNPPVLSTIYDVWRCYQLTKQLHQNHLFQVIHCRGYISSLIGEMMKEKFHVPYIFDMRAFYADERVDGGLWNQSKWLYRKIYQYFKKKEIDFLETASYTISLTQKGKNIIHSWKHVNKNPVPIQVIPCCADLNKFNYKYISSEAIAIRKQQLHIEPNQKVVSYLGSVGTWYMPDEMMQFFAAFQKEVHDAILLFITTEPKDLIEALAKKHQVPLEAIKVIAAQHHEVPELLSVSNFSLFFIKPLFSKSGSSPTKMGEIMGLGIPLICNAGVGDVDDIVKDTQCGVLLKELTEEKYKEGVKQLLNTHYDKKHIRSGAEKYYALSLGVERYFEVYKSVLKLS